MTRIITLPIYRLLDLEFVIAGNVNGMNSMKYFQSPKTMVVRLAGLKCFATRTHKIHTVFWISGATLTSQRWEAYLPIHPNN